MGRRKRALILVASWIDAERQEKLVLPFCAQHGYVLTSITSDPEGAVELVRAGCIDVVVVAQETRGAIELGVEVKAAGGRLEAVRPLQRPHQHGLRVSPAAAKQAAERGATPEQIAVVLGVEVADVLIALRSQEWGEHPWKTDNKAAFPNRPPDRAPARLRHPESTDGRRPVARR